MSKFVVFLIVTGIFLNGLAADELTKETPVDASGASDEAASEPSNEASADTSDTSDGAPDIYTKASVCPHRFHMGCLLDVVEKSCTGMQAIESCATNGNCDGIDELERIVGALDPNNFEALNKCCCKKAFPDGGYEDCKDPDSVCKKAIDDHIAKDLKDNVKLLQDCLDKKEKSVCKDARKAVKWVGKAIQKARGEMWSKQGCKILAPPEPLSNCGWDVKPESRAIERPDLYCDTIIWQFKEMGASDPFMAQCKDAPKMPEMTDGEDIPEGVEEAEEWEEEAGGDEGDEDGGEEGEEPSDENDGTDEDETEQGADDPEVEEEKSEEATNLRDEL